MNAVPSIFEWSPEKLEKQRRLLKRLFSHNVESKEDSSSEVSKRNDDVFMQDSTSQSSVSRETQTMYGNLCA